jgi:hypothetical protein
MSYGICQQTAGERPVHHPGQRGQHDPDDRRAGKTHQRTVALRQYHIGQAQEDGRGVDRQARQRALGDERRIMVEREEYVRRPRRNRQGRDQRAYNRPRAFRDDGRRHHERGGDRHAQRECQDEGEIGGHFPLSLRKQGPINTAVRIAGKPANSGS